MKECKRPQDSWDWLLPEDVSRFAMLAFADARRDSFPPAGEKFVGDGVPWTTRGGFADSLSRAFTRRIEAEAHRLGVPSMSGQSFAKAARFVAADDQADGVSGS